MSARLALPDRAGSQTVARNSLSLIWVIATDLELGFTITEIRRAMGYYTKYGAADPMVTESCVGGTSSRLAFAPVQEAVDRT